jgi:D-tyrosyl-tRNA(Tyr) deacylase
LQASNFAFLTGNPLPLSPSRISDLESEIYARLCGSSVLICVYLRSAGVERLACAGGRAVLTQPAGGTFPPMRAVIQRVSRASVTVDAQVTGAIGPGLLVYVGVAREDTSADVDYIVEKVLALRIFNDDNGKMNRSVVETGGGILVISAFALQADARKGRRPSFDAAADPTLAEQLYNQAADRLAAGGLQVARGVFRAHMFVESVNDGPICILLDSRRLF